MNISFRECADLAERLSAIVKGSGELDSLDVFANERRREWRGLLGLDGDASCADGAPEWARELTGVLPMALPASGPALAQLLGQLGLSPPQGAAQSSSS